MNKEAFIVGFRKAGMDLNLDALQVHSLWTQVLNYPESRSDFEKMSDEKLDMDVETLDTLANLEGLEKLSKELGLPCV